MLRLSLLISLISVASSLVSFVNQLLIARFFGAGANLDSYLVAISVPTMAMAIASGVFSYAIVPLLVRRRTQFPDSFRRYFGALLLLIAALGVAIPAAMYRFCPEIVRALAPNLPPDRIPSTILMSRICWATLGCSLVMNYLCALHNTAHRFIVPVLVNMLQFFGMIGMMLLYAGGIGVVCLPWGVLIGNAVAVPLLLVGVINDIDLLPSSLRLWREILPVFSDLPWIMVSLACFTMFGTIDAFWGSRLHSGAVAYLGYGQRIVVAFGNIVILGPSTVLSPHLAEASALGDHGRFQDVAARAIRLVIAISFPCALALALLCGPLVQLLFQRGAFDGHATAGVSLVLPFLFVGMVAMLGVVLMIKALHARGDIRGAAAAGAVGAILYFVLSGLLSRCIGLYGIPIAYALCWWLLFAGCAVRIFGCERATFLSLKNFKFVASLAGSMGTAAAIIAAAKGVWLPAYLSIKPLELLLRLAWVAGLGAAGFVLMAGLIFKMDEIMLLLSLVRLERICLPSLRRA